MNILMDTDIQEIHDRLLPYLLNMKTDHQDVFKCPNKNRIVLVEGDNVLNKDKFISSLSETFITDGNFDEVELLEFPDGKLKEEINGKDTSIDGFLPLSIRLIDTVELWCRRNLDKISSYDNKLFIINNFIRHFKMMHWSCTEPWENDADEQFFKDQKDWEVAYRNITDLIEDKYMVVSIIGDNKFMQHLYNTSSKSVFMKDAIDTIDTTKPENIKPLREEFMSEHINTVTGYMKSKLRNMDILVIATEEGQK